MAGGYSKRVRMMMTDWVNGKTAGVTPPAAWYVGLSTLNVGDSFAAYTSGTTGEPTLGTNGYARSTSIGTTAANWTTAPSPSDDAAAVGANAVAVAFAASTGAWTTTTTALAFFFVSDSTTSTSNSNFISRGGLTPSTTTVNATGITLSFAIGALTLNLTPV